MGAHCHFAIDFWEKIIRMAKNCDKFFRHNGEIGEKIDGKNGRNGKMTKKCIAIFRHYYYFFAKIDGEMAMSPPILYYTVKHRTLDHGTLDQNKLGPANFLHFANSYLTCRL